jgi:hypothetical protein
MYVEAERNLTKDKQLDVTGQGASWRGDRQCLKHFSVSIVAATSVSPDRSDPLTFIPELQGYSLCEVTLYLTKRLGLLL